MTKDDLIRRQDAIDAMRGYWSEQLDALPTQMTDIGEVYGDIDGMNKILKHNKALSKIIQDLPSVPPRTVCIAKVTLSDEQIQEVVEKAKEEIAHSMPICGETKSVAEWCETIKVSEFTVIGGSERKDGNMQNEGCQKLLNCPFCNGKAKTDMILGRPGVACTKCRAFMRALFGEEENEVIEAWNRRYDPEVDAEDRKERKK